MKVKLIISKLFEIDEIEEYVKDLEHYRDHLLNIDNDIKRSSLEDLKKYLKPLKNSINVDIKKIDKYDIEKINEWGLLYFKDKIIYGRGDYRLDLYFKFLGLLVPSFQISKFNKKKNQSVAVELLRVGDYQSILIHKENDIYFHLLKRAIMEKPFNTQDTLNFGLIHKKITLVQNGPFKDIIIGGNNNDNDFYTYKNQLYEVEDCSGYTDEEVMLLIKEKYYKYNDKFVKLKKELELIEKIDQTRSEEFQREPIPEDVKFFVWRRDQAMCVKCHSQKNLEFDHIIPVSKGGSNSARNIQLLCEKCNRQKSDNI